MANPNYNFWQQLPQPFFCLAPMADVTDVAFRRIIAQYGKPDITWTEFVSVEGLSSDQGRQKLLIDLAYDEIERPIVAQIFGSDPQQFFSIAKLVKELGFDGVDINMGCPEKSINKKQCAGAELIRHPKLAQEIILATKEGAGQMPVSVKTRTGYSQHEIDSWIPTLAETKPAAITLHGRTKKEMSKVPAHWDLIAQAAEIVHQYDDILFIGNGDVVDLADAQAKVAQYGVDGVMIGRGIFGNPWLFNRQVNRDDLPLTERWRVLVEHAKLYEDLLGPHKPFDIMKKHFKAYVHGFDGAKELRMQLMETKTAAEVEDILGRWQGQVSG